MVLRCRILSSDFYCANRFRQIPTFGNGVIRTFANNTSEMKKLAARDFEDMLQVVPLLHYHDPCSLLMPLF